jgi:hypothetical protein
MIMLTSDLFLNNKYTTYYQNIIARASTRIVDSTLYYEKHHIIPKSLKGSNDKSNIALLLAKEHYICHLLLTKMVIGKPYYQMIKAFEMMLVSNTGQSRHKISAQIYSELKIAVAIAQSALTKGKPKHSLETRALMSIKAKGRVSGNKGKTLSLEKRKKKSEQIKQSYSDGTRVVSDETRLLISRANTGQTRTQETKDKISASRGQVKISKETCEKISNSLKGKRKGIPSARKGKKYPKN